MWPSGTRAQAAVQENEMMVAYTRSEAALTITHCSCFYQIHSQGVKSVPNTPGREYISTVASWVCAGHRKKSEAKFDSESHLAQ